MSLVRVYSVFCDYPGGCARWVADTLTSKGAREEARRAGWVRIVDDSHRSGRRDLCPTHREWRP